MNTDDIIRAAVDKFRAPRRERFIHAGGRGMRTHGPGERSLWLPTGTVVKVTTCDADTVTHIEEDDALHAVIRPQPVHHKARIDPDTGHITILEDQ